MSAENIYQYGQRLGLKFAVVGLGIALGFTGLIGILGAFLEDMPLVVIGAVVLALYCGWLGGGYAAKRVYQGKSAIINGFGAAFFTVAGPTLVLSLPFALMAKSMEYFWVVLFGPIYVILIYGGIPMIILGLVFGLLLGDFDKGSASFSRTL